MRKTILNILALCSFTTLLSCSGNNELRLVKKIVTISSDAVGTDDCNYQIEAFGDNITYESEDKFVATVDSKGLITGKCCGTTHIYVRSDNGSAVMTVTVAPTYSTFPLPCLNLFGHRISEVRDSIGPSFTLADSICTEKSAYLHSSSYSTKAPECFYEFSVAGSDTLLRAVEVMVYWKHLKEASLFFAERYYVTDVSSTGSTFLAYNALTQDKATLGVLMNAATNRYITFGFFANK